MTRKTDLVIEGFPRSGNTFARNAFLFACNDKFTVTSHLHSITNVRKGLRLQKPVLILIRKPIDAICSLLVYKGERFPVDLALFEYIYFYSHILEIRDQVVIASFEEVTEAFDQVIDRVNQRYKTSFPLFEHTPENVQHCIDEIGRQQSPWLTDRLNWSAMKNCSFPVQGRSDLKQKTYENLSVPELRDRVERAEIIYERLTQSASGK